MIHSMIEYTLIANKGDEVHVRLFRPRLFRKVVPFFEEFIWEYGLPDIAIYSRRYINMHRVYIGDFSECMAIGVSRIFFVLHLTLQPSVLKKAFFKMRVTICGSLQE